MRFDLSKNAVLMTVLLTSMLIPLPSLADSNKLLETKRVRIVKIVGWQNQLTQTEGNLSQFYWTPIYKRYRDPSAVKLQPGHKYAKPTTLALPRNPGLIANKKDSEQQSTAKVSAKMLTYASYGTGDSASHASGNHVHSSVSGHLLTMERHR